MSTDNSDPKPDPTMAPGTRGNNPDAEGKTKSRRDGSARTEGATGGAFGTAVLGGLFAAAFYAVVYATPWQALERYFSGHPVAIAATILFWMGIAILLSKWFSTSAQWNHFETIRDEDLTPGTPNDLHSSASQYSSASQSPASQWLAKRHAGTLAQSWLGSLDQLPFTARSSHLVARLREVLTRQAQRGTTKNLDDDLRELSARDADASHDSYSLVRIIVWAIPMLGFLGTVIGITQTLGGLDFSDGTAAVDRLKSGLYVAFDTTALGIVLSVVAIFLQFPVERSEQRLLAAIDMRVGRLVSLHLPSDDASDNPASFISELCDGIRVAVAESLAQQTELWRSTIDTAQERWHDLHQSTSQHITDAFAHHMVPALREHASAIDESSRESTERIERTYEQWQNSLMHQSERLLSHQQSVIENVSSLQHLSEQSEVILALHQSLDVNLTRIQETNQAIDRSVAAAAGDGMADAMRILARAVDVLSARMSTTTPLLKAVGQTADHAHASSNTDGSRRAA